MNFDPTPDGYNGQSQQATPTQKIVIDHAYADFDLSEEAWDAYGKENLKI